MAKAVVAVVRNGVVDPVVLRGDVEVGVLDLDSADTPDPDGVVFRVGGRGTRRNSTFPLFPKPWRRPRTSSSTRSLQKEWSW